jgi:short-subunit dehydrogenase involved in D-alanine esterification of teichoic acids
MDPPPQVDHLPTADGGRELYKAAGKLKGKKAIITGGDSGIGRSVAVLFAMEGADSFIAYLPEEEDDAQETVKLVEEKGQKCYTYPTDLKDRENCKKVVEEAVKQMGGIDILVNNHAYQMMVEDIKDLDEYVPHRVRDETSNANNEPIGISGYTPSTPTYTRFSTSPNTPCRT